MRYRSLEDLPLREGLGRREGERTEYRHSGREGHWLKRYLRRQVGRPWSQVQAAFDRRLREWVVDQAVRDHVRANILDNLLHPCRPYGGVLVGDVRLTIDPATGLLCCEPIRPRRPEPAAALTAHDLRREPEVLRQKGHRLA